MRNIINLAAISALALGAFAFVGCDSNNKTPPSHDATSAGGNGEFGESPARAGQYDGGTASPAPQPGSQNK